MLTLCECRAKKLRGKNTTNLSTLLITILFALSVRPHKALPPTSPKGMLVAIIRPNSCSPRRRVIRLCRFLVTHLIDVREARHPNTPISVSSVVLVCEFVFIEGQTFSIPEHISTLISSAIQISAKQEHTYLMLAEWLLLEQGIMWDFECVYL